MVPSASTWAAKGHDKNVALGCAQHENGLDTRVRTAANQQVSYQPLHIIWNWTKSWRIKMTYYNVLITKSWTYDYEPLWTIWCSCDQDILHYITYILYYIYFIFCIFLGYFHGYMEHGTYLKSLSATHLNRYVWCRIRIKLSHEVLLHFSFSSREYLVPC